MAGFQMDLRMTAATAAQLMRKREREPDKIMELDGMVDSALIRYGRYFNTGARTAFEIPAAWINELPADLRQAHKDFLALRNKHIAHSVNDWELNIPVAHVAIDRDTDAVHVRSVSVSQSRVVMLSSESLDLLWRLAKTLADRVEVEIKVEQTRLLEEHVKQIPVEELRRRILEDRAEFPGQRNVGRPRRRS